MTSPLKIRVNGREIAVPPGASVAAALALAGVERFRRSVAGEPRAPLCGMGICQECRAVVNGHAHARTCILPCREGMEVKTDE